MTLEGKIIVFKPLVMSKIVNLALITNVPITTAKELNKTQMIFFWKNKNPKIKHTTSCSNYDKGSLRNAVTSDKNELNFKFHSNLNISVQKLKIFTIHYIIIFFFFKWSVFSELLHFAFAKLKIRVSIYLKFLKKA